MTKKRSSANGGKKQKAAVAGKGALPQEQADRINALEAELQARGEELEVQNEELRVQLDELHAKNAELEATHVALKESEAKYRELVENANSIIVRWDTKGCVTFFNEYAQQFFGYAPEEIIGREVSVLVPATDSTGSDLTSLVMDIKRHPERYANNVNENVRKNGERVWVTWTNRAIRDRRGKVAEILAIGNDITGLRNAEQALQEKQEKLEVQTEELEASNEELRTNNEELHHLAQMLEEKEQQLVEGQALTDTGSWEWDLATGEVAFSDSMLRILGLSPGRHTYHDFTDLIHPDDRGRREATLEDAIKRNQRYETEYRIVLPGGEVKHLRAVGRVTRDVAGKPAKFTSTIQDITGRKQAEEAMHKQAVLIDLSPDGIIVRKLDGEITFWSKGAEALYGWTEKEAIGRQTHALFKTRFPAPLSEMVRELERTGRWSGELTHTTRDGRDIVVQSRWLAQFDDRGFITELLESNVDITDLKLVEKSLQEKQEELEMQAEELEAQNEELRVNYEELNRATRSLEESDFRLRLAMDAGKLGWHDYRPPTGEIFVDDNFRKIWGLRPDNRFDINAFWASLHPEDVPTTEVAVNAALDPAGDGRYAVEYRVKPLDGSPVRWVHATGQPVFEGEGSDRHAVRFIGTVQDITGRKRAEETLKLTQASVDGAAEMVAWFTSDGKVFYANDATCRTLGYSREELLNMTALDFSPGFTREQYEQHWREVRERKSFMLETTHRRKDGSTYPAEILVNYVQYGGREFIFAYGRDITERKRAEQALVESEARSKVVEAVEAERQRLFGVLETIPAMVCLLTPDYHVAFANRSFRERFGEARGRHCYEYCWGQAGPCEFCESFVPLTTGQPHHWEARGPDGSVIECHDYPFTDVDGSPMILEMDNDITERKKAEEVIRHASAYHRSLIEASMDPLVTIAPDGKITDVNTATEAVTGLSRAKLVGTDFSDYFTDPEKARKGYRKVFEHGSVTDYPLEVRHQDGHTTQVLYNASVYRDETGRVAGVFAAARDITARLRAEQAREAERKRLFDVLETLPAYLILLTPDYHVAFANRVFRERFGEDHGRRCYEFLFDRTEPCENCETYKVLKTHAPHHWEWAGPDGRNYDIYDFPFKDTDGSPLIMEMGIDITERKRAEAELEAHRKHLEDLVQERTRSLEDAKAQAELYLDLMGHDISNMHQIILGQLQLAQEVLEDPKSTTWDKADLIDGSIVTLERSAKLIDSVQKLQKLKHGEIGNEKVDINKLLAEVVENYSQLPGRDIAISFAPFGERIVTAHYLLKDVFNNLLDNAVKHSVDPVAINVDVGRVERDGRAYHRVTIEDNGRGIPDDRKEIVFHRFKRGQTKAKGTGLGLYIVKTLVESLGGFVEVEDRVPGDHAKGARFIVDLPAEEG